MAENKNKQEELEEQDDEIIVLADDEGVESEFRHIATLDFEDEWYIYLHPLEGEDVEDDEMFILRIDTDEEGNDIFVPIEDEKLIDKLYDVYLKEYEAQNKN